MCRLMCDVNLKVTLSVSVTVCSMISGSILANYMITNQEMLCIWMYTIVLIIMLVLCYVMLFSLSRKHY